MQKSRDELRLVSVRWERLSRAQRKWKWRTIFLGFFPVLFLGFFPVFWWEEGRKEGSLVVSISISICIYLNLSLSIPISTSTSTLYLCLYLYLNLYPYLYLYLYLSIYPPIYLSKRFALSSRWCSNPKPILNQARIYSTPTLYKEILNQHHDNIQWNYCASLCLNRHSTGFQGACCVAYTLSITFNPAPCMWKWVFPSWFGGGALRPPPNPPRFLKILV